MINPYTMEIKVIDFSLAQKVIEGELSTAYIGTPSFSSPQIQKRIPYSLEKNQIWQLGTLLYTFHFGIHGIYTKEHFWSIRSTRITRSDVKLLHCLLAEEEKDRPTFGQLLTYKY
jgi:serine/threonine protein kinase